MNTAFGRIELINKYVNVWDVFETATPKAVGKMKEEKIEILGETARRLIG